MICFSRSPTLIVITMLDVLFPAPSLNPTDSEKQRTQILCAQLDKLVCDILKYDKYKKCIYCIFHHPQNCLMLMHIIDFKQIDR